MSIDTETTAGKISIMQAFEDGAECQWRYKGTGAWEPVENPSWNWDRNEYRIKPTGPREFYVSVADGVAYHYTEGDEDWNFEKVKVREVIA